MAEISAANSEKGQVIMKTKAMVLRMAACVLALTVLMGAGAYPAEAGWGYIAPAAKIVLRGCKIILPYGDHVIRVVEKVGSKTVIRIIEILPVFLR